MTEPREPPAMPSQIARLPRDKHGRIIPWFVAQTPDRPANDPDFRVADGAKLDRAILKRLCWVCGRPYKLPAFILGPMCAVNRTTAEPPCHRACAIYSAQACPFLSRPHMRRRDVKNPHASPPAGISIERNPGVALVWVSRHWSIWPVDNGVLFDVGEPSETLWFAEGREATREEVMASILTGLPLLRAEAEQDERPEAALAHLETLAQRALTLIPA